MRFMAASCFVSAAFAWVPPWVDRAGLALLGFGFLALAVGRGTVGAALPLPFVTDREREAELGAPAAIAESLAARLAEYTARP